MLSIGLRGATVLVKRERAAINVPHNPGAILRVADESAFAEFAKI
jgi:hypothetical protein